MLTLAYNFLGPENVKELKLQQVDTLINVSWGDQRFKDQPRSFSRLSVVGGERRGVKSSFLKGREPHISL